MGTLEVHDPQGRVQFVMLSKEHPVVFGSSKACDVVLVGEGIKPVEGRIRWKRTKYRVEASPDAEFVLVNGNRMSVAGLRPGDEITVKGSRIFLMQVDDEDVPDNLEILEEQDDRTRVAAPPVALEPAEVDVSAARKESVSSRSKSRKKPSTSASSQSPRSKLDQDDWLEILEPEKDSDWDDAGAAAHIPVSGTGGKTRARSGQDRPGLIARLLRRSKDQSASSGKKTISERLQEEKLLSSPLVLGLLMTLAALVLLGLTIYAVLVRTLATRLYTHATEALDNGDYLNSIRDFDSFLKSNPEDSRAGKARVLRSLANVRQYVSPGGSQWSNALEAAKDMFADVQGEPEFRDERAELGELTIRIGEGLADRARASADRKSLAEAESILPLHGQITGEAAKALLGRSSLPSKLNEARAAIRKSEIRAASFTRMDEALKAASAKGVYSARDDLIRQYGDLANDRELIKRMVEANDLIRRAVKTTKERRAAESQPRPEPLGPPTGIALRTSMTPAPTSPISEEIVFALADGFSFGLDGSTGAPLWQKPVGLASPFPPQRIQGDPSCLAVDSRYHDLLRLNSATGELIWRQALGEPVQDAPLVLGNQIFQVLPSGKMLVLALDSGEIQESVETGFPLSRSPIADESGRNLYLLARRDCLLVITRDPLACVSVEYLGHADGSIPSSPSRLGRFLIVPENHTLDSGRWRIFVIDSEGTKVRPAQEIPIAGWTWSPPPTSSSMAWSASDRGTIEAFAAGDYSSVKPFKPVGRLDGEIKSNGPVYALARTERELWAASANSGRFDLEAERGTLSIRYGFNQTGPAVGPIQVSGKLLIFSFQDPLTMGTSVQAVDPETGATSWRTVIGARWLTPPTWTREGDTARLNTTGLDGRTVEISRKQIDEGHLIGLQIPRSGDFSLPLDTYIPLTIGGRMILVPGGESRFIWLSVQKEGQPITWRKVDLPSPLAATPLVWGGGLLVPAADSRIYVIDPDSARSIIEPFVPVFDRERTAPWLAPASNDPENVIVADGEGRIRRLALRGLRMVAEAEVTLDQKAIANPATSAQTVVVATADRKLRALAARDLSPIGSWPVNGLVTRIAPPSGGHFFVADSSGGVLVLAADGRRRWSIELGAGVVGDPLVVGQSAWFLTTNGVLHSVDLETGKLVSKVELHILPSSGPMASTTGSEMIIPVGRGTFQTLAISKKAEQKP